MSTFAQASGWTATRKSYDALVERAKQDRLSCDEGELLRDSHWNLGQDARLREDVRFRPTPWNRWILADCFLANDAVWTQLHRERRTSINVEAALAALDSVVGRRCVLCPADPRLVIEDGEVRLSARELSDKPLIEEAVTELQRYVTHLPVHSLKAAAASAPAGQWGRRAQEQVIETLGWLKVTVPGRKLNVHMFVAQIEGHSMDDGRSGLVDGGYAVFELWPSGSKQNLNVLVRGAFTDPETGSYAVKRYVGDVRGADGRHKEIRLVSLNPDRARFPDIVPQASEDEDLAVVAKVVHALAPDQFARRPRAERRRGRRDISSAHGRADIAKQLEDHVERFFSASPAPPKDDAPATESWSATLVCMDAGCGALHVEVGPLRGLWSFVKRVVLAGQSWDSGLLTSNLRERSVRVAVPPSSGPWRFSAPGFEDDADVDFSMLQLGALEPRVHVFRVDGDGVGRAHQSLSVSPGQHYRLLLPSQLADALKSHKTDGCGPGWHLWDLELVRPVPQETAEALRALGLILGDAAPSADWVVTPPAAWRTNARGETYACFTPQPGPVVQFRQSHVEVDGEAAVFLHGPEETTQQSLPRGEQHLLNLGRLEPGRYALGFLHHRSAVAPIQTVFEIVEAAPPPPPAKAEVVLGSESHVPKPGDPVATPPRDMSSEDGAAVLESLSTTSPPGWPVRVFWKELVEDALLRRNTEEDGTLDTTNLLSRVRERASRRPVGDIVFDFAELGRVVLPHHRHPEPESVRARVAELLSSRGATAERLAGSYAQLLPMWFEPVCAALGFDVEPMPDGHLVDPPEHSAALRLLYVERQGARIERQPVRLLVLVERVVQTPTPQMLEWIDQACVKERLREVLLSDGYRWAAHRRGSKLALKVWDLKDVAGEPEAFVSFLHVASEGV